MLDAIMKGVGSFLDYRNAEKNRNAQMQMAQQNIALQKEFAQSGVQWKVADAKAAGIHPLAALGAQLTSFSPVSLGAGPESSFASDLGGMGQDITRAINATRSQNDRDEAFKRTVQGLEVEGKQLDNEMKRSAVASSIQRLKANSNPPMPTPGVWPLAAEHAEKSKPAERELLALGGTKWSTDKGTSPGQSFENEYQDLGNIFALEKLWRDYVLNTGEPMPRNMMELGKFLYKRADQAVRNYPIYGRR